MLGKVFWGLVILLFIGILVIPFVLPSYYASQAKAQYSENFVGDDDLDIDFKKNRRKTSSPYRSRILLRLLWSGTSSPRS